MAPSDLEDKRLAVIESFDLVATACANASKAVRDLFMHLPLSEDGTVKLYNDEVDNKGVITKSKNNINGNKNNSGSPSKSQSNGKNSNSQIDASDSADKPKKKKKKADPDAPKKPQGVFFIFACAARKLIREQYEKENKELPTNQEIVRQTSDRWRSFTDEQKEPWKKAYEEQVIRYKKENAAYERKKKGLPPIQEKEEPEVAIPPPASPTNKEANSSSLLISTSVSDNKKNEDDSDPSQSDADSAPESPSEKLLTDDKHTEKFIDAQSNLQEIDSFSASFDKLSDRVSGKEIKASDTPIPATPASHKKRKHHKEVESSTKDKKSKRKRRKSETATA